MYKANLLLKNSHINTMFPHFFRDVKVQYERERLETVDGDFFDIDKIQHNNDKVVILCHGLEGSSYSQYIRALSKLLNSNNIDTIAINHRSCSGEINRKSTFYHAGFINDLDLLVKHIEHQYDEIYLVGYSLGANMVLKYAGVDNGLNNKLKGVIAVSCPLDLQDSSITFNETKNLLYRKRFLKSLKDKLIKKIEIMPNEINMTIDEVKNIKTMLDFDNLVTSRMYGYKDANDYYRKESAINYIDSIKIKTLIVNAKDDPILSSRCYPDDLHHINKNIFTLYPKHGGHVGFANFTTEYYWIDYKILKFINKEDGE